MGIQKVKTPKKEVKQRFVAIDYHEHTPTTTILEKITKATPGKETISKVLITPAIARDLLSTNIKNRHIRQEDVERWIEIMKAGKWMRNGATICFSTECKMLDGQHRCIAIIESNKSQTYDIVCGLDPDAFDVIDTGRSRNGSDVLSEMGFANYHFLSAAIKTQIYFSKHQRIGANLRQSRVANYELKDWINDEKKAKRMITGVTKGIEWKKTAPYMSVSSWAFLYFTLAEKNVTDAEHFLNAFVTGENISSTKDSPIYFLREKILSLTMDKKGKRYHSTVALEWKMRFIVKAWNHYRDGEKIKSITIDEKETKFQRFK